MYFDYKDWRCQLRNIAVKPRLYAANNYRYQVGFIPHTKTEAWFYHFCYSNEYTKDDRKKTKGKCDSLPPFNQPKMHGGWSLKGGYQRKWCQRCSTEMPLEILDYFAKALELWRLADPNR